MADSLYYQHGTSDEYYDPYCDICFETKGYNVKVYGYCKDCFQFLCTDCHVFHQHVQATRKHTILQGMDMPQSQAEKPVRFEICDVHSKQVKDEFCANHNILLCPSCSSSKHKGCAVSSVEDACKNINSSEINELYDKLNEYKKTLDKTESSIIANIDALKEDKKNILKEAQDVYDEIIAKADELLNKLKTSIEKKFKSELSVLQAYQKQIQDTVSSLESSLSEIAKLKEKVLDTKGFLKVHEIVSSTKKRNSLTGNICTIKLLMEPSQIIKDFLCCSAIMRSVSGTEPKISAGVILPDIKFPARATKAITSKPVLPLSAKVNTYNIKVADDKENCFISGMAIMYDGNRILVDRSNSRLKMFSPDMKIKAFLTMQDTPWDISVVSDSEVVVSADNNTIVIVGISSTRMGITKSHKSFSRQPISDQFSVAVKWGATDRIDPVRNSVTAIAKCKDKFVVISCQPSPASVKLIDLAGNVYWSLSRDQHGQPLFNKPLYLCHHTYGTSSTVIVTDYWGNSLTLVNGETGEVITRRQVNKKGPLGVTTDNEGNIYVCYGESHEVAILNRDLSEERILLARRDGIANHPRVIAYDDTAHQFIIAHGHISSCNSINYYKLK